MRHFAQFYGTSTQYNTYSNKQALLMAACIKIKKLETHQKGFLRHIEDIKQLKGFKINSHSISVFQPQTACGIFTILTKALLCLLSLWKPLVCSLFELQHCVVCGALTLTSVNKYLNFQVFYEPPYSASVFLFFFLFFNVFYFSGLANSNVS